jgi:hypothetical protein
MPRRWASTVNAPAVWTRPSWAVRRNGSGASNTGMTPTPSNITSGRRLARQLPAPGRQLRSDVLLSVISGVLLMRRVVGARHLDVGNPDQLVVLPEAVFAAIVDARWTDGTAWVTRTSRRGRRGWRFARTPAR